MESRIISWDIIALKQFNKAIDYIAKDSVQNAEKVRADFLKKMEGLLKYPERDSPDKYKTFNNGNFRAFELHHYRVSYHAGIDIRIVRVRHTKRKPQYY